MDNFAPVLAAGGAGKKAHSRIDLDIIVSSLRGERCKQAELSRACGNCISRSENFFKTVRKIDYLVPSKLFKKHKYD